MKVFQWAELSQAEPEWVIDQNGQDDAKIQPQAEAIPFSEVGDCFDLRSYSDMNQAIYEGVFTSVAHATDDKNGVQKLCFWTLEPLFS